MTKNLWAVKQNKHCLKCKHQCLVYMEIEGWPCFVCDQDKCRYTKKELKKYSKTDDGDTINLRILK